ncbi:MAG TPA: Nif3-like dinuclear metal center hexameric protein [Natronosporangium sp.]|nr:Nif3-like dinuclear metal center hexameric protein [Natronosporangium sp.]
MTSSASPTVATVTAALAERYPPEWAASWDRVGLVLGEPSAPVTRVLCVVDCVPETVAEAVEIGADLIVAHHPLLLRPVSSVAPTTYKGRIVHDLIRTGVALYVAHTNADVANPGVSDALAARLGLAQLRPLRPGTGDGAPSGPVSDQAAAGGAGIGAGRIGVLPEPLTLAELTRRAAAALPPTAWGVRAAGDPQRQIRTVAVCGGAGDSYLADAAAAGVDAYLTADLRHHPASEHLADGGPALLDAAHWATERPWLDELADFLRDRLEVNVVVSDLDTDPWTVHATGTSD